MRKYQARFGGGPMEKDQQWYLASGLPNFTGAGTPLTKFTLATNRLGPKNEEGQRSVEPDWHRVECWGHLAEQVAEAVKRGSRVQVSGSLKQDKWTDSDGKARSSTVIVASDVVFLDHRAGHSVADEGHDEVESVVALAEQEDEPAF